MTADNSNEIELLVENVAFGGKGVARRDGKVYFVEDCVPGDRVMARITEEKKRYAGAEVASFLAKSPLRRPSPCSVSHLCGGCQWQEIPYEEQLGWKSGFVGSALQRIGLVEVSEIPITPSPSSHNYRSRVLVRCHADQEGRLEIGYFRRSSRDLVAIPECKIAEEQINQIIRALAQMVIPEIAQQRFRLEVQLVPASGSKCFATIFPAHPEASPALAHVVTRLRSLPEVLWAGQVFETRDAPYFPFDKDEALGRTFYSSPGQFQQVNFLPNRTLRQRVYELVEASGAQRVFDLFCGSGNLSLALVHALRFVAGVESNPRSIACAQHNLKMNALDNAHFVAMDATKRLWQAVNRQEEFQCIIADPPREGMAEAIAPLLRLLPQTIVYVSCDPATLARDVSMLCRTHYELKSVEAFDFFPNTFHVESLALLVRR